MEGKNDIRAVMVYDEISTRRALDNFEHLCEVHAMCRNIRVLFNTDPPTTDEEVRAAALQFVRKVSGFAKPSAANEAAFNRTVKKIADASSTLLKSLVTAAPPRNRDAETARARARAAARFGARRRTRGARASTTVRTRR